MLYFAYGSNMDHEQMAARCPGATLVQVGCLHGHRFSINGRGYATVLEDHSQKVYGLIWKITSSHAQALDGYESVPIAYLRHQLPVSSSGQAAQDMLVYVSVNSDRGIARQGYMEKITAAARRAELPLDYQALLMAWLPGKSCKESRSG